MTASGTQLRVLCFGDVDGGVWGAALGAGRSALVVGEGPGAASASPLDDGEWSSDGRSWRLAGAGFDLSVEPQDGAPSIAPGSDGGPLHGAQELCRVRGTVSLNGADRELDCIATRSVLDDVDESALGSLRAVGGWFATDEAFALLALRSARNHDQESDAVQATLFDPDGQIPVHDPRLSTTYDGDGSPARMNLELWIGEGENEFPRRTAGEASETGAAVTVDGMEVRAVPLRCHSRGRDGAGVYLLATQ
jgi:hypothetical protein